MSHIKMIMKCKQLMHKTQLDLLDFAFYDEIPNLFADIIRS